jgi:hypothetical protein
LSHAEREEHIRADAAKEAKEDAELEAKIQESVRKWRRVMMCLGLALLASIVSLVPFLAGDSLHSHWDTVGKKILLLCMFLLPAFMYAAGITYTRWSYLRDVRKINSEFRARDYSAHE